jgi:hypothetical protein
MLGHPSSFFFAVGIGMCGLGEREPSLFTENMLGQVVLFVPARRNPSRHIWQWTPSRFFAAPTWVRGAGVGSLTEVFEIEAEFEMEAEDASDAERPALRNGRIIFSHCALDRYFFIVDIS